MARIDWQDANGASQSRVVNDDRWIFKYPKAYPEASLKGAHIVCGTITYYYDSHGDLRHYDNRGEE